MMWAHEALERFIQYEGVKLVLDIGCGDGEHAQALRAAGKEVVTIDIKAPADIVDDFMLHEFPANAFDGIWCSHVLEHQPNVSAFLRKCRKVLRPSVGLLAITVPPLKHEIVGGHLTLWNQGLLVYNLVVAGFDCSGARVSPVYDGYNISVITRNVSRMNAKLKMDAGDIETLAQYFPFPVRQGFDGSKVRAGW